MDLLHFPHRRPVRSGSRRSTRRIRPTLDAAELGDGHRSASSLRQLVVAAAELLIRLGHIPPHLLVEVAERAGRLVIEPSPDPVEAPGLAVQQLLESFKLLGTQLGGAADRSVPAAPRRSAHYRIAGK